MVNFVLYILSSVTSNPQGFSDLHLDSVPFTYHACCLHGLAQTGSIGLAPEHVADEISRTFSHDEGKSMYIFPHAHEWQEANTTLR